MKFPLFIAAMALVLSSALHAVEPAWPEPIIELERMALRDPRPGAAWLKLRYFALQEGLQEQLRQRWESRAGEGVGAPESILLGWLHLEDGNAAEARACFQRAAVAAPASHPAWRALAELQLRTGDPEAEASVAKALELAATDAERVEALRLPALIAQERGEFAKAWTTWKILEEKPLAPTVRLALVPDFYRAHQAMGDVQAWVARVSATASASQDDAAVAVAAVLAAGDAALAYRLALKSLERDDSDHELRRLAAEAAQKAGFATEAASRVEVSLGEAPEEGALLGALNTFVELGAPDHILRLCRRHADRLLPVAARWRPLLYEFWKLGVIGDMRRIFARSAAVKGWEASLVTSEMAILDGDLNVAAEPLWHLLDTEFDQDELSSAVRAEGNSSGLADFSIALREYGLPRRISRMEVEIEGRDVFEPDTRTSLGGRPVSSLVDARDLALVYLQNLALLSDEKAAKGFLTRLRERIAHWPLRERFLAYVAWACPEGLIDTAAEIATQDSAAKPLVQASTRQLKRLRLIPNLEGKLSERLAELLARPPLAASDPSRATRLRRRSEGLLLKPFRLFEDGKFAEADQAFNQCLEDFTASGLGPTKPEWAQFHGATALALAGFPEGKERARAASYALRWLALQTPRRDDWPCPPNPQVTWRRNKYLTSVPRMFAATRGDTLFVYGAGEICHAVPLGGAFPPDLWAGCLSLVLNLKSENDPETLAQERTGLGPESDRFLTMLGTLPALLRRGKPSLAHLEELFDTPDRETARLLVQLAEVIGQDERDNADLGNHDFVVSVTPDTGPGQAGWLLAGPRFLHPGAPVEALTIAVERLLPLPLDNASYERVRETLSQWSKFPRRTKDEQALARAWLGKFALAHKRPAAAEPLLEDAKVNLDTLLDAAEVDEAVVLARHVVSRPQNRIQLDEPTRATQLRALEALQVCGELNGWFAELQSHAKSGGVAEWRRLAVQSRLIVESLSESEGAKGSDSLLTALRRSATQARLDACSTLVRLDPGNQSYWSQFKDALSSNRSNGLSSLPSVDLETMLRAVEAGVAVETVVVGLKDDAGQIAELVQRGTVKNARRPGMKYPPHTPGLSIALSLWDEGKKEAATMWLRKLFEAHGADVADRDELRALLVEALAAKNDRPAIVRTFAHALRQATAPSGEIGISLGITFWGDVVPWVPPLGPMMEQVRKLGLDEEVLAEVTAEADPQSIILARLLRLNRQDTSVLPEIAAWVEEHPPMQFLEFMAERLASWKEGQELAGKVLRLLEPAYAWPTRNDRVKQLSRYAGLAARCGLRADAAQWWRLCLADQKNSPRPSLGIFFDVFEVASHETRAELVEQLRAMMGTPKWSDDEFMKGVQRLMEGGHRKPARALLMAMGPRQQSLSRGYARSVEAWGKNLDAGEGEWGDQLPVAWLQEVHEDGTSEIGWTLGWFHGDGEKKSLFAPSELFLPPGEKMRVEIYFGRQRDRMERLIEIKEAGPSGVVRGPFDFSDGFIAISVSMGERAILGPALSLRPGKNLIPPLSSQLDGLPSMIWSQSSSANENTIRSVNLHRPESGNRLSPATAQIVLPALKGKDLMVSGWIKGGKIDFGIVRPDGSRKVVDHAMVETDPIVWTWIERKYSMESLARMAEKTIGAQFAILIAPGSEYRGLRAIAVEPSKADNESR